MELIPLRLSRLDPQILHQLKIGLTIVRDCLWNLNNSFGNFEVLLKSDRRLFLFGWALISWRTGKCHRRSLIWVACNILSLVLSCFLGQVSQIYQFFLLDIWSQIFLRYWCLPILEFVLAKVCRTVLRLTQSFKFVHVLVHFAKQVLSILMIVVCKTLFSGSIFNKFLFLFCLRTSSWTCDCVHHWAIHGFGIKFLEAVFLMHVKLFWVGTRRFNRFHFFALFQNFGLDVEIQICKLNFLERASLRWVVAWLGWFHFSKTAHGGGVWRWRKVPAIRGIFEAILNNLKFRTLL